MDNVTETLKPAAAVKGCSSGGGCGTGSCNKLNVYDWLSDISLPAGQETYNIVEVRFKGTHKGFFRNKESIRLQIGDVVAVEATPGHDIGVVSLVGETVKLQMKKKGVTENSDHIRQLYRKAKSLEIEKWQECQKKEMPTLSRTRDIIKSLNLQMKLSDVEYQGDGKKATFYYTADERVDFRQLIKRIADEFKIRVEMRQVGMRQEAGRLGGIGSCGRELCCSTWLTDFRTVSTNAARYQTLALNPAKLAGQCGKLKCCLNYELDSYMDALKGFPPIDTVLFTEKGKATHRKTDIFKGLMWFAYGGHAGEQVSDTESGYDGGWVALTVDRVKEIMEMNSGDSKPADLKDVTETEIVERQPDYQNVVGQDRIDRMVQKKKKKKKHRRHGGKEARGSADNKPRDNRGRDNRGRGRR